MAAYLEVTVAVNDVAVTEADVGDGVLSPLDRVKASRLSSRAYAEMHFDRAGLVH
jgi:uncharacterized MnhB-related membrane protein